VIVLSLLLVLASAAALGWGIATTNEQLVWASLLAGLAAVALVVTSVVRHRRRLAGDSGTATLPGAAVPAASDPPRSTRSGAAARSAAAPGTWPWSAADPDPGPDPDLAPPRSGWTGAVTPAPPASPAEPGAAPVGGHPPAAAARRAADDVARAAAAALGTPTDRPLGESFPDPLADDEPPVEEVPVRDALRVAQLADEVRVVDGHPRYHLGECPTLAGAEPASLPVSAARRGGFTPCAVCAPDRALLARSRNRRAAPTD
jgi:hypothetical protein